MSEDVQTRLTGVFREVFGQQDLVIHTETTAKDIAEWDSLMHINLLVAIEKEFGIIFHTGEMHDLQNVGQLMNVIGGKLNVE